jgi:hypothetical protein
LKKKVSLPNKRSDWYQHVNDSRKTPLKSSLLLPFIPNVLLSQNRMKKSITFVSFRSWESEKPKYRKKREMKYFSRVAVVWVMYCYQASFIYAFTIQSVFASGRLVAAAFYCCFSSLTVSVSLSFLLLFSTLCVQNKFLHIALTQFILYFSRYSQDALAQHVTDEDALFMFST